MPHKAYDKYKNEGDIHWQWYNNDAAYNFLVDDSLAPFKIVEPGTVVDIGMGDGLPLSILQSLGFKCYGVDDSYEGIDLAMKHGVSAECFHETAEKFARRHYEFDYLYSLCTIEHLDDPLCMVELMRNVKKFGVIVTDNDEGKKPEQKDEYHENQFTPSSFEEMFKEFNLERLKIRRGKSARLDTEFMGWKLWKK